MRDRPEIVDPLDWAPEACSLPTAERPLRVAEFDELFTAVLRFDRPQPSSLGPSATEECPHVATGCQVDAR